MYPHFVPPQKQRSFSALQRAEIAEIVFAILITAVSVCFSALQRAEIAEITPRSPKPERAGEFQCSSTSRNC